ncbi:4'-phosphopantetheinyl transferase superfamily protein [Microbacterium sp.]|uniref:holo-ACP synthase n=1 Tax=Microbacterium sp. TaxID=51671 RepID=UPI0028123790|nr:4'-phosphopantetheinyl transferase superfamily protein [Microbacterium sp.]
MTIHGVGVDVADARRIQRLLERGGEAVALRWLGDPGTCGGGGREGDQAQAPGAGLPVRALAECFAAKEAVWKALALPDWAGHVPWPWIDIRRDRSGVLTVTLSGPVAAAAERAGAGHVDVAAHSRGHVAIAFAVVARLSARRSPAPAP